MSEANGGARRGGERDAGVGSPGALRHANRHRVLELLRRQGPSSQSDIARTTGLSRATVSNIVREMRASGAVVVSEATRHGRRVAEVSLNPRAGLAVGVDFGHRHVRVALADLSHTVLAERQVGLPLDHGAPDDLGLLRRLVGSVLEDAGADRREVLGMGMGLPGPIDPATGVVGPTSVLPGWVGVAAGAAATGQLGMPVVVDNDANLGALAEMMWGAGQGKTDLVYIKASTGIGAGLVLRGEIYRGAAGTAGEIGHTTIDERSTVCRCGNRGCLESYAGANALLDLLRPTRGPDLTLEEVIVAAREGDPGCQRVIVDAAGYIGRAVANLCNLLGPPLIVVGGDLAAAGDLLLDPLRDVLRRHAFRPAAQIASIVPAALGGRAEVLGAVALALREIEPQAAGSPRARRPSGAPVWGQPASPDAPDVSPAHVPAAAEEPSVSAKGNHR